MVRVLLALLFSVAACTQQSPFPDMQAGETGRVTRIIDGDALVLDTGQTVRLVSIEAPALYPREGDPRPHAGESARRLEDLALGRRVRLYYPGLTRDRYDRALAHVVTIDGAGPNLWLNMELIKSGAAWVRLYPSTAALGQDLLVAETAARAERSGLWAISEYAVRAAERLSQENTGFFFVTAALGETLPPNQDTRFQPACLRQLLDSDLRISIRRDAATACGLADGTRVFIRGWIREGEIDLTHPWHLEVLEKD